YADFCYISDSAPPWRSTLSLHDALPIFGGGEPLTAGQVGLALRQHLTGVTATHVTLDGQRLPVVLRPSADEVESLDSIRAFRVRSEEHTSELQSRENLVCRLLLEKKKP